MKFNGKTIGGSFGAWLVASTFVAGCVTVTGPPVIPTPSPQTIAMWQATCAALFTEELGRAIDPPGMEWCLAGARGGADAVGLRTAIRATPEWAAYQERLRNPPPPPRPPARTGAVRLEGFAVADAGGPFNALGASLFWGAWGYKFDRARLEGNLAALAAAGVDYVRVIGSVGPDFWTDRITDVTWADYDQVIAGFTDLAYDTYGIRTQWTIFGGSRLTPPGSGRAALVDKFLAMSRGREHKLFAFEVGNEAWQNGFEDLGELRALGRRLATQTDVIVMLSAPGPGDNGAPRVCDTYAGAGVDATSMHYDRDFGGDDVRLGDQVFHFRPVRQPWGYPGEYDAACPGQLPKAAISNEPIGPESSVAADDQPLDLVMAYVVTFVSSNAAYVLHAGPGIRGGGREDLARGRHANIQDLPSWAATSAALQAAKRYLPAGLANWQRQNAQWPGAPFTGYDRAVSDGAIVRAYSATSGPQFLTAVLGIRRAATAAPRQAVTVDVVDPLTGEVLRHLELAAGEAFTLDAARPAVLLRGRVR